MPCLSGHVAPGRGPDSQNFEILCMLMADAELAYSSNFKVASMMRVDQIPVWLVPGLACGARSLGAALRPHCSPAYALFIS